MNPLFLSHIVADFLLQPTNLVLFKQRHKAGVILHAAIHAGTMYLLILPKNFTLGAVILAIAVIHGLIDVLKIRYQKKNAGFNLPFLFDQLAHAAVLIAAAALFPLSQVSKTYAFWQTEEGFGMAILFFFWSFFVGFWHIKNIRTDHEPVEGTAFRRSVAVICAFIFFLIPSLLFAASGCFAS